MNLTITPPCDKYEDTVDAFFRGKFYLVQPKKHAHRIGMDALLLASCVPQNFNGTLADFGSGCGGAGIAALVRTNAKSVTLIENSLTMLSYAEKTIHHTHNQHLAAYINLLNLDLTSKGSARKAAGLLDNSLDFIIMNPPFNNSSTQASQYKLKAHAHIGEPDLFDKWLKIATACLKAKGTLAIIARPESLDILLKIMKKAYGKIQIIPVYPNLKADAIRLLMIGTKGAAAPIMLKPGLTIRYLNNKTKKFALTAAMSNISNGLCSIYDV